MTLCLEPDAGQIAADTARQLSEKLEALSGGRLTLLVKEEAEVLDAMLRAGYDLYLITNRTAAEGLEDYGLFSSPYFFEDYDHLSMALGSKRLRDYLAPRTRAALGVEPMAAFYNGSRVFIQAAEPPAASYADLIARSPALLTTPLGIFEDLLPGGRVLEEERLIDDFARRRTRLIDFDLLRLDALRYPEGVDSLYLVQDFHQADINWLMLATEGSADTEPLSDHELALLSEAVAYALAYHDRAALETEQQQIDAFGARFSESRITGGGRVAGDFRAAIRAMPKYQNLWNWETYDMLRAIGLSG